MESVLEWDKTVSYVSCRVVAFRVAASNVTTIRVILVATVCAECSFILENSTTLTGVDDVRGTIRLVEFLIVRYDEALETVESPVILPQVVILL